MVRSVASTIGGPCSGILVSLIGKRPLLTTCAFIIGVLSFYGLFQSVVPLWVPIIGIGLCDGAAASLIKSLYVLAV